MQTHQRKYQVDERAPSGDDARSRSKGATVGTFQTLRGMVEEGLHRVLVKGLHGFSRATPYERRFAAPFDGPVMTFGASHQSHTPTTSKTEARTHRIAERCFLLFFCGCVLSAEWLGKRFVHCRLDKHANRRPHVRNTPK